MSMRVFIIRHAKAHQNSETGLDIDRPLKGRGRRQAEELGAHFAALDDPPALVLSSPYLRARQTAERIWSALGLDPQIDDRLGADRSVHDMLDVIHDTNGAGSIALVGHNPNCARTVAMLLQGIHAPPMQYETARTVCIDLSSAEPIGSGTLIDSVRPQGHK